MIEKIFTFISLLYIFLIYVDFDITTKIGKIKFFLFELFTFIKVKIINTLKNKFLLIYFIYCITINYFYQKDIIKCISNNTISYDIINMILFYILIVSATLLDNNNNNLNKNMDNFYDNISFCLINLIWLTYMLIRIVIFFLLEIFYLSVNEAKNIGFDMIISTLFRSFIGVGVFGSGIISSILISGLSTISGKGYEIYRTDEKIKKIFNNLLNDFKNKQIDFLYKYILYL